MGKTKTEVEGKHHLEELRSAINLIADRNFAAGCEARRVEQLVRTSTGVRTRLVEVRTVRRPYIESAGDDLPGLI